MKNVILPAIMGVTLIFSNDVSAGGEGHSGHHHKYEDAPIGVMGDHLHDKGDWMVSYRYSAMKMKGNRKRKKIISAVIISVIVLVTLGIYSLYQVIRTNSFEGDISDIKDKKAILDAYPFSK